MRAVLIGSLILGWAFTANASTGGADGAGGSGGEGACPDADGDGFDICDPGDAEDTDGRAADCDDDNSLARPGNVEYCNDFDDDCDGLVDEGYDADGDGVASCFDCDPSNPAVYPGATEVCDGLDNDCNYIADDGFDADGDGFTVCGGDCDDNNPLARPGNVEYCNGFDDDCDGLNDEGYDEDGDGFTICNGDCDDADASVNPQAAEPCDGVDNNCNDAVDEGHDEDGDGVTWCAGDCDDQDCAVRPGNVEYCNGFDDNCDGQVDEGLMCTHDMLDGVVCLDLDGDGVPGPGDPLLEGYEVVATGPDCDGDGEPDTISALTNLHGTYWMSPMCAGEWTVSVVVPAGEIATSENPVTITIPETRLLDFCVARPGGALVTRTMGWWKHHDCVIEMLLPLTVGPDEYETVEQVLDMLNARIRGDKTRLLRKHILVSTLNSAAFGIGPLPWEDGTVASLLADALEVLRIGDRRALSAMADRLDALNNVGVEADLPAGIPEQCHHRNR